MKRRPRRRYHAMRRVPQAYPGLYLRLKVAPILPALAATVAVGALAEISALPDNLRGRARSLSDAMGTAIRSLRGSSSMPRAWTPSSSAPSPTWRAEPPPSGVRGRASSSPSARTATGEWPACVPSSRGADTTPS